MSSVWRFVAKVASIIVCTLHCFDRVIFKGHLAIASAAELERFADWVLKVRRCHFMNDLAPRYSEQLVVHAQAFARKAGRTYLYRTGSFKKDQWAEQLIREQRIEAGLVGILCTQETCNSFVLVPGEKRPRFISKPRQQRVLYYYLLDPQLGFLHVRLQTWAPFTLQVYVNGHNWLAQQLVRLGMGFVLKHNAFTQLDDPAGAQRQADRFARLDWPKILNRYAHQVNPLLRKELARYRVRWVVDQAEFATDLLFTSPAALTGLYQKLLQFATVTTHGNPAFPASYSQRHRGLAYSSKAGLPRPNTSRWRRCWGRRAWAVTEAEASRASQGFLQSASTQNWVGCVLDVGEEVRR